MNFQYRFTLPVPVEQAWEILLDLRRVAPCMPGAAIESGEGDQYVGRMKVKLGPIEMAYRGELKFLERDDAAHRLKVEGVGKEVRGGGGAKAIVSMEVVPTGSSCAISINADYSLSGRAAQFGSGMIDEIGAKLMKEFVTRLERLLLQNPRSLVAAPIQAAASAPVQQRDDAAAGEADLSWQDNDEALDLVGLAWGPVASRAVPILNLVISAATLIYLVVRY